MGMSSTQMRFLQLTRRNDFIGCQLATYSLQKTSLASEMDNVSLEFNNSLNREMYRMTVKSSQSQVDLTYDNLMRPSLANNNKPYLLTNRDGKVVLDSKYLKYAELISPEGNSGGDWKTYRSQVLEELTGVPKAKLDQSNVNASSVKEAQDKIDALKQKRLEYEEPVDRNNNTSDFIDKAGIFTLNNINYDLLGMYNSGAKLNLGSAESAKIILQKLFDEMAINLSKHLRPEDVECFKNACGAYMNTYEEFFGGTSEVIKQGLNKEETGIYKHKNSYSIDIRTLLNKILSGYATESEKLSDPAVHSNPFNNNEYYFHTRNTNSVEWITWKENVDQIDNDLKVAYNELDHAIDEDGTLLTSEEENNIEFYDQIFNAIAEKGWIYNDQIEDKEYINNMLQNNLYYLTTVEKDKDSKTGKDINIYTDNIAQNLTNIVKVTDINRNNDILLEFNRKKKNITDKESRIDVQMGNLKVELESNKGMLESLKRILNDNIDRTIVTG